MASSVLDSDSARILLASSDMNDIPWAFGWAWEAAASPGAAEAA